MICLLCCQKVSNLNYRFAPVQKYDNQAIASEFIKHNKVSELISILNIDLKDVTGRDAKIFSPKQEAISSILIFGSESKEFRTEIFDCIIKSYLCDLGESVKREVLINFVQEQSQLSKNQHTLINSRIDSLLQRGDLLSVNSLLNLSPNEQKRYEGLRQAGERDFLDLKVQVRSLIKDTGIKLDDDGFNVLIEKIVEITKSLGHFQISTSISNGNQDLESYLEIKQLLLENNDIENVEFLFELIADTVADSAFGGRILAAELFSSLVNANSMDLLNALGGKQGALIYLDSSVVIPMLCGLLYEARDYRYGYSGKLLFDHIKEHNFTATIPDLYVQEIAAHLIDACRNYKYLIGSDIDLAFSDNAFVSHYTNYSIKKGSNAVSFEDYVSVFGIDIKKISSEMDDISFFRWRDRCASEFVEILAKYNIFTVGCDEKYYKTIFSDLEKLSRGGHGKKPEILIEHDAKVIKYLCGTSMPAGNAKILCTWDKNHATYKSIHNCSYEVLTPVSLIDLFSLAKPSASKKQMVSIVDFAKHQSEKVLAKGAIIIDEIAKIEKDNLEDAELILKAKKFKAHYMGKNSNFEELDVDDIARSWDTWKK
ncbi:hypothetical protein [uncultured Desulfobacter sp.]|uniref:hypothetical protein n=1 Tax=uncultured Desulfobacter sp. TaxID=240139 RepID=UPI0029C74277|nr:hypothetical protein [uncultured Desulfobacter sp.]